MYVFFSSSLLSEVAERQAAANKISSYVISDLQTMGCPTFPTEDTQFLVLHLLSSDRNLTESEGTCGSNFYSSLMTTAGGKEKIVPIPPQRTTTETKGHTVQSKYSFCLIILYLQRIITTPDKQKKCNHLRKTSGVSKR